MSCAKLIEMMFEDEGFKNIQINSSDNTGKFESELNFNEVKSKLDKVFEEAKKYSYSDLKLI